MAGNHRIALLSLLLPLALALTGLSCKEGGTSSTSELGARAASEPAPAPTFESTRARLGSADDSTGEAPLTAPERKLRASSFEIPATSAAPGSPEPPPTAPEASAEMPLSLTASDGTGLALRSLTARAVIEAPLAFTELFLTFENPENRTLEGRFQITLPPGATVSRFAMKIGERWQEGEVVERQAAREAYEDFLHRRQDPALLEQEAGNSFSARVFPIPARARKEIILSYSQALPGRDARFLLPLKGLPELGVLDVKVVVSRSEQTVGDPGKQLQPVRVRRETLSLHKEGWTPSEDFVVETPDVPGRLGLRNGNLVALQLMPIVGAAPDEIPSLCVLVDTSASRALGFHRQIETVRQIVSALAAGAGAEAPVLIAAFDQTVAKIYRGGAGGFDAKAVDALRARRALGASDLQGALGWLAATLEARPKEQRCHRALILTDGVATAGETEGDTLRQSAAALAKAGIERLDALVLGGIRDTHTLRQLVTAGLPRDGVVIDGDGPLEEIGRRLTEATVSDLKVKIDGAKWIWPETLDGIQTGDEVLVFADLPADAEVVASLEGGRLATDRTRLDGTEKPLLERAWVQARIARLAHQRDTLAANDDDLRAAMKLQMTELSVKHRVLSPFTAFLVLETEADYRRFGIDRKALTEILTVGETGGVTLLARSADSVIPEAKPEPDPELRPPAAEAPKTTARLDLAKNEEAPVEDTAPPRVSAPEEARRRAAATGQTQRSRTTLQAVITGERNRPLGTKRQRMITVIKGGGGSGGSGASTGSSAPATGRRERARRAPTPARPSGPTAAPSPARPAARAAGAARVAEARASDPVPADARLDPDPGPPPPPRAPVRRGVDPPPGRREGTTERGRPRKVGDSPWTDSFLLVKARLGAGKKVEALEQARGWREESPGDVLALIALGESLEATGDLEGAARAYGSIIDLFPSRADLRRYAGNRLEALPKATGLSLAADTYAKAAKNRPDHPAGHRLLAYALLRQKRYAEAFAALETGLEQTYPGGRFLAARTILGEDLALVAAAWAAAEPRQAKTLREKLRAWKISAESQPSLRFVLSWETDANDVDFHIFDGKGGHAYYSHPRLASGGNLYGDVTTGYGPECFTIRGPARARPYTLQAHYYRRGPMGYGMGLLQVIRHDGRGKISVDPRPYVVMRDGAYLDLGVVR